MKKFVILSLMFLSLEIFCKSKNRSITVVKPKTSILTYSIFSNECFFKGLYSPSFWKLVQEYRAKAGKSTKIVLLIVPYKGSYPFDSYIEDNMIYKNMNIGVFNLYCNGTGSKFYHDLFCSIRGDLCFSLLSDTNKKIKIYGCGPYGFHDESQFRTSHKYRIGILIDENNYIVSILDHVQSKEDIFKGFGIK